MKSNRILSKPLALMAVAALSIHTPLAVKAQETVTQTAQYPQAQEQMLKSRASGICPNQFHSTIDSIVKHRIYASGVWGVHIESLNDQQVLYSYNATRALIPASNIKLFTTAAALQMYDPLSPIRSTNLQSWINTINKRSHNGYADSLLKSLGGPKNVKQVLSQIGVPGNAYRQVDGSGLSRQNLASPLAIVDTLKAMNNAYGKEVFYRSLPVAGIDGTLRNRLKSTPAQGIVHAKTGTLRGVRALSGYMEHPEYGPIVFSILVNQPGQSGSRLLNGIDQIVLQMSNLTRCYPRY